MIGRVRYYAFRGRDKEDSGTADALIERGSGGKLRPSRRAGIASQRGACTREKKSGRSGGGRDGAKCRRQERVHGGGPWNRDGSVSCTAPPTLAPRLTHALERGGGSCWLRQQPAADGLPTMLTTATRAAGGGGVRITQRTINRGSWREVLLASRPLHGPARGGVHKTRAHTDRAAADVLAMVYGPVDGGRTTLPPTGGLAPSLRRTVTRCHRLVTPLALQRQRGVSVGHGLFTPRRSAHKASRFDMHPLRVFLSRCDEEAKKTIMIKNS
ncbi:hypothetical protein MTO96_023352 [Rhipicephalus appendiculatus]